MNNKINDWKMIIFYNLRFQKVKYIFINIKQTYRQMEIHSTINNGAAQKSDKRESEYERLTK